MSCSLAQKNKHKCLHCNLYDDRVIEDIKNGVFDTAIGAASKIAKKKVIKIKEKKKYVRFEEEKNVEKRIEKVREELHNMLHHYDGATLDVETIELSQYLDKLLVTYTKAEGINNQKD